MPLFFQTSIYNKNPQMDLNCKKRESVLPTRLVIPKKAITVFHYKGCRSNLIELGL